MAISWTKSAGELATMACQRVQMLGTGQTATGHVWSVAKDHMNGFLKLLQTQGPNEWRKASQPVTLVDGTATYTLDPRPDSVEVVLYRDAQSRDRPMVRWNRNQYQNIPYKSSTGLPVMYLEERGISSTTLTMWPVPDASAALGTLVVDYERVINDVVNPSDALDIPQEWVDGFADIIGARMASSFNLANPSVEEVKARAAGALDSLLGYDREEDITFIMEMDDGA
jgi:hypothetical protein